MPTIKVIRKNTNTDILRKYKLLIDNNELENIARNEIKELDIAAGSHTIMAKIDWGRSKEIAFNIKDGDSKTFEISSFPYSKWIMPLSSIFILADIIIQFFFPNFELFLYLAIPGFLLLMYYISFGRSRYLTLKEI
jgi:hypothetical protein